MPKTTHFSTDKDKIKLLIVCISYTINMVNMKIIQNVSQLCNLICRRDRATILYNTHIIFFLNLKIVQFQKVIKLI